MALVITNSPRVLLPGLVFKTRVSDPLNGAALLNVYNQHHTSNEQHICVCPTKQPRLVLFVTQTDENALLVFAGEFQRDQLHGWGTRAKVLSIERTTRESGTYGYTLLLEGLVRVQCTSTAMDGPLHSKVIEHPDVEPDNDEEFKGLTLGFRTICQEYLASLTGLSIPPAIVAHMKNTVKLRPVGITCDIFASLIDTSFQEKLEILVMTDVKERMRRVGKFLKRQIQVIGISRKLLNSVDDTINKKQREMILRQQMAAIKKELGETTESNSPDSIQALEIKLEAANLPKEAKSVATKELARLKRIPNTAAEHQVIRNYLDCILDIPWSISTIDNNNISKARESLDADHFGMEKVKERIIQYLAVRKLKNDVKGPIMCLLGPPGVGKTSLGKSIANALGRKFHRISLGGVHDEAEIRGHRRTYVASMPGLLVQALIRCGSNNPVILLDEIDKVGRDSRGDPSAALLEVLDPEQNSAFTDHYLNVPIDLSNVLFIATANDSETIRAPLLDRTELVELTGYSMEEKVEIAKNHLLPRQMANHGLGKQLISIDDHTILQIVSGYTRESGVRNLEREISSLCRNVAVSYSTAIENGRVSHFDPVISDIRIVDILGAPRYERDKIESDLVPGVATGLAWSPTGGGLLFVEVVYYDGTGQVKLTGKLGTVILESAQLALAFVKANANRLGVHFDFEKHDIHVHFPAGAVAKDGPSAGVTLVTAITSLLTNNRVRQFTAMTGEISLRGLVLPVGGIKEKLLAARFGGIKRVIVPEQNKRDVDNKLSKGLQVIYAKTIWDVLDGALQTENIHLPIAHL